MENLQNPNTINNEELINAQESGRGKLILVLGILSVIFLGPFVGIPAWVMGHKDLKKIKNGIILITEKSMTKAGMILGIIGTFVSGFNIVILGIAVVVGINLFSASSIEANRDAMISDCINIAAMSQQYYRKPSAMGGGNNSFIGLNNVLPGSVRETINGTYTLENIEPESLIIIGIGKVNGNDDTYPIKILIKVTPESIEPVKILN